MRFGWKGFLLQLLELLGTRLGELLLEPGIRETGGVTALNGRMQDVTSPLRNMTVEANDGTCRFGKLRNVGIATKPRRSPEGCHAGLKTLQSVYAWRSSGQVRFFFSRVAYRLIYKPKTRQT